MIHGDFPLCISIITLKMVIGIIIIDSFYDFLREIVEDGVLNFHSKELMPSLWQEEHTCNSNTQETKAEWSTWLWKHLTILERLGKRWILNLRTPLSVFLWEYFMRKLILVQPRYSVVVENCVWNPNISRRTSLSQSDVVYLNRHKSKLKVIS